MRNQRGAEAAAYRRLYKTARWQSLRDFRLSIEPLCRMCREQDKLTVATVVDHIEPHYGDLALFFDPDNTQSLCKAHHDGAKQSEDRRGYSKAVGPDGWPTDERHPANSGKATP